jgi:rare lipoprotein A
VSTLHSLSSQHGFRLPAAALPALVLCWLLAEPPLLGAPPLLLGDPKEPAIEEGLASWYGGHFHGNRAADGRRYSQYARTAAHRTLPLGSKVRVTNLENGKKVVVQITDRGPVPAGRILDLSYAAARRLGMVRQGVARVRLEVLRLGG